MTLHRAPSPALVAVLALSLALGLSQTARAVNLLPNSGFDSGLAPWQASALPAVWSPEDAGGSPHSGSIQVTNSLPGPVGGPAAYSPCVAATPGTYEASIDILLPAGQGSPGWARMSVRTYSDASCSTIVTATSGPGVTTDQTSGQWTRRAVDLVLPSDAAFLQVSLSMGRSDQAGTLSAYFDNAAICPGSCSAEGGWIDDDQYPDFRFRVTITPAGSASIVGTKEPACLPELVCISGALPGRSEVFVRVIGPRPNGYLWPTILRSTPSGVQVEIEQRSRGQTRVYSLDPVPPGDITDLSGLQDREGFEPQ